MSDHSISTLRSTKKESLGDRIRNIANQLRQEDQIQIKATSRILGAAAQIAQNHDRLIDEVVEMVEEDLNQSVQAIQASYTPETLQQQFKSLKDAKAHFGVKASSWVALAAKLNGQSTPSNPSHPHAQEPIIQRLEAIEESIQAMRGDINQILMLLQAKDSP